MDKTYNTKSKSVNFNSRLGYIMVAAGAAIGLGNIWKFPYLAYGGGGGAFVFVYLIVAFIFGHAVVEMETTIGRFAKTNAVDAYGVINKKWKFIGVINVICTFMIDTYYLIVSGYVLHYAYNYLIGGDFGSDSQVYYSTFISNPVKPLIFSGILAITLILILAGGITGLVEKISKYIMPLLFILLVTCGLWSLFTIEGAFNGLKFYLIPDFSKFTWKTFADVCMQVMFSVGIGWGIYSTLGATLSDEANIRKDSIIITCLDTLVALIGGFVIIPSVVGSGSKMVAGPSLIFNAMPQLFAKLPGGKILAIFFFIALLIAVMSTFFTILEIPTKFVEEKFKISHTKATVITMLLIFVGGALCSLSQGNGLLSHIKMPWWNYGSGIVYYNIYDWVDCFSGYVLLPLGCLLTSFYVVKVWGFKRYEEAFTQNGRDGKLTWFNKFAILVITPILTIIVILNVFGFIK